MKVTAPQIAERQLLSAAVARLRASVMALVFAMVGGFPLCRLRAIQRARHRNAGCRDSCCFQYATACWPIVFSNGIHRSSSPGYRDSSAKFGRSRVGTAHHNVLGLEGNIQPTSRARDAPGVLVPLSK